jgi:uncharacterized protein (AIM24 family)
MPVRDQLHGSTQPVLTISLEPGESVVAETGEFAWMTDSIRMTARGAGLSDYTATDEAGTIAFASRLPGSILPIEVSPEHEYLVHRRGFLAGTPGIEVTTGFEHELGSPDAPAGEFQLLRISGAGRAWVGFSGEVVRRDLAAGSSLRTHPEDIGMSDASVTIQLAELAEPAGSHPGQRVRLCAVLSGPGAVWLQSMPPPAAPYRRFGVSPAQLYRGPNAEGAAGPGAAR